jgi:hypothetical protein
MYVCYLVPCSVNNNGRECTILFKRLAAVSERLVLIRVLVYTAIRSHYTVYYSKLALCITLTL